MNKESLKRIFDFLEAQENKTPNSKGNLRWKLIFNEPLPEGLKVDGYLNLNNTPLTSLPKGLKVRGYLSLSNTKITSLPEDLKVGRDLNLSYSKIMSLPKGLEVGRNLNIRFTPLTKYLDDELKEMIQPGFIKGEIIR